MRHPGGAVDQIAAQPPHLRDELALVPTTTAPAAARAYVHDLLDYWRPALSGQASPRLLRLVPHDPESEGGRGLRLWRTGAAAGPVSAVGQ